MNRLGWGFSRSARSLPRASSAFFRRLLASFSSEIAELICWSSSISALLVSMVRRMEPVKCS